MKNSKYWQSGVIPILGSAFLWGLGYFCAKLILHKISPFLLTLYSSLIASIFLYFWYQLRFCELWSELKEHPVAYLTHALAGVPIATTLMLVGLSRIDLGVATVLQNLYIVFTPFIAHFVLKERLAPERLPFAFLAFAAAYFVSTRTPFSLFENDTDWIGVFTIIGAAAAFSVAAVAGKVLVNHKATPAQITFLRFALGSFLMLPGLFFPSVIDLHINWNSEVIGITIFSGIFSVAIAYILLYRGLEFVPISTCVFLELLSPLIALSLGILFLAETLVLTQIIAIPLILYAVYNLAGKTDQTS